MDDAVSDDNQTGYAKNQSCNPLGTRVHKSVAYWRKVNWSCVYCQSCEEFHGSGEVEA